MKEKIIFLLLFIISNLYGQDVKIAAPDLPKIIEVGNKFALKNGNGNIILSDIDSIGKSNKQDIYIVKKENKYGMYSFYGQKIIPIQYDVLKRFFNQFWLAVSNNKKEIYNIYTNSKLPLIYDEILFSNKVGMEFIVKKESKYGIFNANFEEIVPIVYDKIENLGIIQLELNKELKYILNGKIVYKNIFPDKTFYINKGQYSSDGKTYYVYEYNQKLGIIDFDDNTILSPQYDEIMFKKLFGNKLVPTDILIVKIDNQYGIIDIENNILIPIEFESIEFTDSDFFIVGLKGKKQIYDFENKKILEGIYFDKYIYLSKYSRIENNGKETLIDNRTMKLIFPFKYESIISLDEYNYFTVSKNGKFGIIDSNDKEVIPLIYDNRIFVSCGNKIVVQKDEKYGIIDLKNKILLPFTNRHIESYSTTFERRKENSFEMEIFDCNLKKIKN